MARKKPPNSPFTLWWALSTLMQVALIYALILEFQTGARELSAFEALRLGNYLMALIDRFRDPR